MKSTMGVGRGKLLQLTLKNVGLVLHTALRRLTSLPRETLVYCGHEYTRSNFRYAASISPSTPAILARQAWAESLLSFSRHTVPSTIGDEMETNVFVKAALSDDEGADRCEEMRRNVKVGGGASAVELLGAVRVCKNNFK